MSIIGSVIGKVMPPWVKWAAVAVFIVAITAGGGWVGYKIADTAAQVRINKINATALSDQAIYQKKIADLMRDQRIISGQLQDALVKQADVVTVYVPKIIKETSKPIYIQCVVPDTGVSILNDQAQELNAIRGVKQ